MRLTSARCEDLLIKVWDETYPQHLWKSHLKSLPKPEESLLARGFNPDERRSMFYRVVQAGVVRLMMSHCDTLYKAAQEDEGLERTKLNRVENIVVTQKANL